ncbi:MAG: hypothetical protein ACFFAE_14630 [Candidatus Hodarchaeota archaeon]
MNYSRRLLPLSILLLLFMNIAAIFLIADVSSSSRFLSQSVLPGADQSTTSPNHAFQAKIGTEITSGKTTLRTDKDRYAPGELVEITAESDTSEMNGSLEWSLESPIGEVTFDFSSDFQDIFEDRFFNDPSLPDWTNDGFYSAIVNSGYLNLTEVADADINDVEIYYDTTELDADTYEISFDYFSKGQNLLLNPGFEGGNTTGWDFNSLFVKAVEDPNNASERDYYAEINGTEGYLLNQTVNVTEGIHEVTLIIKATGNTDEGYWSLRLEAYNSSGIIIGEIENYPQSDSRQGTPDDKGYVTQIMNWETPDNTTQLRVAFRGRNATGVDALYTGWLDDCYLGEVPPSLKFSYWGAPSPEEEKKWRNITLSTDQTTLEWENYTFQTYLGIANISKTFRFILPDENSFSNNATSYWFIDNMKVNFVTVPEEEMGPIVKSAYKETFKGEINSTWIHRGFFEKLSSSYEIKVEAFENKSTPSDCQATIQVQLPKHQVYLGSWIFMFEIHQIQEGTANPLDIMSINMSFTVEESLNYVVQDIYMLRGSTNETQGTGNDTQYIFTEYFEKESNIQAISPGDNVTLLGFIEANSTTGEWYSLDYLEIGSASVKYRWDSSWSSRENITWSEFGFISYDKEGETILDGNFSSPLNNASTMALNFKIPNRGIYGNLSANLTMTIIGTNVKAGGVGGVPLTLTIPLDLPPVKYKINILEENLPATNYYITDYLSGNITLEFQNYNDTLESVFPNRNISTNISIPMKDLELTIFLDNLDQSPSETDISQQFHYHYIGNSVLWLDSIKPDLKNGTYLFQIRWNAPYYLGIDDQKTLISHSIQIKGSPIVVPAEESFNLKQGGQKTINFTVHIDNPAGKIIRGLDLFGFVDSNQSYGNLVIYEEKGVYKIDLDIERDAEGKEYTIQIFIVGRSDVIGEIKYKVIEVPMETEEPYSPIELAVSFGGFLFFLLVSLGIIGALFWANKSLK